MPSTESRTSCRRLVKRRVRAKTLKPCSDDMSMELTTVMSALQFQDIPSQQIEGAHALLAELGNGLGQLVGYLGIAAAK